MNYGLYDALGYVERSEFDRFDPRTQGVPCRQDLPPGSKMRGDGHSGSVARVDHLLPGVALGAGLHRIEFDDEPSSWRIGWMISLVTSLGLAATALLAIRFRRRGTVAG